MLSIFRSRKRAILLAALGATLLLTVLYLRGPGLPGSRVTVSEATHKAGAIFLAKLVALGTRDMSADHESSGPEFYHAEVEIEHFYKGRTPTPAQLCIFPNSFYGEQSPVDGRVYVFYTGEAGTEAHTVIKMTPASIGCVWDTIAGRFETGIFQMPQWVKSLWENYILSPPDSPNPYLYENVSP